MFLRGVTERRGKSTVLTPPGVEWKMIGSYDFVLFPVMVEVATKPAKIHFGVEGGDFNWTQSPTVDFGISDHAARAALFEAWKGIKEIHATMDRMPHLEFDLTPMIGQKDNWLAHWRAAAWVKWDDWNKRGLNIPQRTRWLLDCGFKDITPKDLENAKREMKMPGTLREDPLA